MFYCDFCGKKNGWPEGLAKSHGPCEICGTRADCSDVQSRDLPKTPEKKIITPRKELMAFARAMEVILRQNDWKHGWEGDSPSALIDRIWDEAREMEVAMALYRQNNAQARDVQKELVDTANFCMMAWDRLESLKKAQGVTAD